MFAKKRSTGEPRADKKGARESRSSSPVTATITGYRLFLKPFVWKVAGVSDVFNLLPSLFCWNLLTEDCRVSAAPWENQATHT